MRKHFHYPLLTAWVVLTLFLAGCGDSLQAMQAKNTTSAPHQTASPASGTSLTTVNWASFIYSSTCYENKQPFHARNGKATNGYIHFSVFPPKYGDLTGDGQPEAVVPYQCSSADASGVHVFIYTGDASHIRLLANLPLADPKGVIENVTGITISNQELHLEGDGYSSSAPHCCPDLFVKTSYRWDGKKFLITQSTVSAKN